MSPTAGTSLELTADMVANEVSFKTHHGAEVRATVVRLRPQAVTFEVYDPDLVLRVSEMLSDFRIVLGNRRVYSGHAVIRSLIAGPGTVAEAALDEKSWTNVSSAEGIIVRERLEDQFTEFVRSWQRYYLVSDEYKVIIADLETFLTELRLWLEQIELGIRANSEPQRVEIVNEVAQSLRDSVNSALSSMFERFEEVADRIEPDLEPAHRAYGQRQLHAHLLCAPFIHRTFVKPLGYAGDYEMMNMIMRNGLEGKSLYAKLANAYLLGQVGPQAVRGRVGVLHERIRNETSRIARHGRAANVYCIACGPAWEAQDFIAESTLANHARFCLLDFNEETIRHTAGRIETVKKQHHRQTPVTFVKKSVHNLLKANSRALHDEPKYDLIYCSGLYDYLSDRVVKALNTYLYDQLQPGGLLAVGNFAPNTPVRNFIEHFLEWFLIYRDARQLAALSPEQASASDCKIVAEPTGTNIFLEVRKPL